MEKVEQIDILVGGSDLWSSGLSKLSGCKLDSLDGIIKMVREYRPMIDAIQRGASETECNEIQKELSDMLSSQYKVYMDCEYQANPTVYQVTPGEFAIIRDSRDYEILVTAEMMRLGTIYI